mmetsp:Transcript_18284/g.20842  ORF Transcript_18284/g.20842 Transcript_18284/m.20842 type:complete len:694 (+) Transcript_18284:557-2638(+)
MSASVRSNSNKSSNRSNKNIMNRNRNRRESINNTTNTTTNNNNTGNLTEVFTNAAITALLAHAHHTHTHQNQNFHYNNETYEYANINDIPVRGVPRFYNQQGFISRRIVPFFKWIIYIMIIGTIMFFISIGTYIVFYNMIIPENYVTKPIFFDYNYQGCTSTSASTSASTLTPNHMHPNKNRDPKSKRKTDTTKLRTSSSCPPTASIDLKAQHTQWEAYTPNVAPLQQSMSKSSFTSSSSTSSSASSASSPFLSNNIPKPYFIDIELTLPESPINHQIGMFMIEKTIFNKNKKMIASSKRPVIIPYQSSYIYKWKHTFWIVFHLFFLWEERQIVNVNLFDHFYNHGHGHDVTSTGTSFVYTRNETQRKEERGEAEDEEDIVNDNDDNEDDYQMSFVEIRVIVPSTTTLATNAGHKSSPQWSSSSSSSTLSSHMIQISKAELHIGKELNLMQYTMKHWFYTCATCFILITMIGQTILYYSLRFMMLLLFSRKKKRNFNGVYEYAYEYDDQCDHHDFGSQVVYSYRNDDIISELDDDCNAHDHAHEHEHSSNYVYKEDDNDSSEQWVACDNGISNVSRNSMTNGLENESSVEETTTYTKNEAKDTDTKSICKQNGVDECCDGKNLTNENSQDNLSNSSSQQKKRKRRRKKKKKKISTTKDEIKVTMSNEERIKVEKVMKGDVTPYEIFTDLDDPD